MHRNETKKIFFLTVAKNLWTHATYDTYSKFLTHTKILKSHATHSRQSLTHAAQKLMQPRYPAYRRYLADSFKSHWGSNFSIISTEKAFTNQSLEDLEYI